MSDSTVVRVEAPHERVQFCSGSVLMGEFRCSLAAPDFACAGQILNHVIAFPRTAVWIERDRERPFVADPSVATVYAPGQGYSRRPISQRGDHSDWIAVSGAIARDLVARFSAVDATRDIAFRHSRAPVCGRLYFEQRQLFEHIARHRADTMEVEERAISIVSATLSAAYATRSAHKRRSRKRAGPARKRQIDLAEAAKAEVLARLGEQLTLAAIAERLQVSVTQLCHSFRIVFGQPLYTFRRAARLRAALEVLTDYRGNLTRLAHDLGFSSHPHFSMAFVSEFGIVPSQADRRAGEVLYRRGITTHHG